MDENVKLRATIEGDSKPLQNALNQAGQSADQAAKQVGGSVNAVGGSMERAADRANDLGENASKAGMTIGDAMRHPIEAIKQLISKLREAKTGMEQLGEAGKKAGNGSKDVEQAIGAIVGMGSKFAVIAKGFSVIKDAIYDNLIRPIAEAYKEMSDLANYYEKRAGKQDTAVNDLRQKQQAIMDYWAMYSRLQDKIKEGTATSEEREQERQSRRNLSRNYDIQIDTKNDVEKQVLAALSISQAEIEFALDKKIADLETAVSRQKRSVKRFDTPATRATYSSGIAFDIDRYALIDKQYELEEALKRAKEERERAKIEDPADDLYSMNRAKEGDRFRASRDKAAEEARKTAEEEAKARADAEMARRKGIEALDQWASDLLDDDGQKRLNAAFDKYAALIEQGVSEEEAKPILDEAIRQELNKAIEKEAAARESLVKEYTTAKDALKTAMQREQAARESLVKANEDLADLKKQQAKDDRLEKIDRKRARLQSKMSRFGFTLNGSHIGESAADRRERQRTERTDARIAAKLRRAESGRSVYFNDEEKRRINQYKALQKQDRALDKEAKAIRAADRQLSASSALKSASDAIKTAAENLEAATAGREAAQAEANQKRWNAEAAVEKEATARKRAIDGVQERSKKYSMTVQSRGGIAGKAAKAKDYSGYLDKIAKDLGEKIYVVK